MIDIINKAQLQSVDKNTFLSIASICSFMPKNITENGEWKKLPLSAKVVYGTLVSNYDYELGISQITHSQILNESGIGGNATIVKSLDALEEKGFITRVESKTKSHHYLMPYQEKFFASVCKFEVRNLSSLYTINKKSRKEQKPEQAINKLFFKACINLTNLGIEKPDKLIGKYRYDGSRLRMILYMSQVVFVAKKHNLKKRFRPKRIFCRFIEKGKYKRKYIRQRNYENHREYNHKK